MISIPCNTTSSFAPVVITVLFTLLPPEVIHNMTLVSLAPFCQICFKHFVLYAHLKQNVFTAFGEFKCCRALCSSEPCTFFIKVWGGFSWLQISQLPVKGFKNPKLCLCSVSWLSNKAGDTLEADKLEWNKSHLYRFWSFQSWRRSKCHFIVSL